MTTGPDPRTLPPAERRAYWQGLLDNAEAEHAALARMLQEEEDAWKRRSGLPFNEQESALYKATVEALGRMRMARRELNDLAQELGEPDPYPYG